MGNTLVESTVFDTGDSGATAAAATDRARRRGGVRVGIVVAALLAALATVGLAQPAGASPGSPDSPDVPSASSAPEVAALPAVPSCVTISPNNPDDYVNVHNNCSYNVRVKVVIAWGPDSDCFQVPPGYTTRVTWTIGWFDGLRDC
jgi:hypothetical protein